MQSYVKLIDVLYTTKNSIQTKKIIDEITLDVFKNEILCIVGESGSGKTTLTKLICKLLKHDSGEIHYSDELIAKKNTIQLLFQNSSDLLNPIRSVSEVLKDTSASNYEIQNIIALLNINTSVLESSCGSISVGERQRIALARILLTRPKLLVLDEPFSAQDCKSRQSIISALLSLKNKLGITIIIVTHVVSVIKEFADRIVVLYDGKIMEDIYSQEFFNQPKHPYSKALVDSTAYLPLKFPQNKIHDLLENGCKYYSRCDNALDNCKVGVIKMSTKTSSVFCNNPLKEG